MPRAWVDGSQPRTLVEVGQNGSTGYYSSVDLPFFAQPYAGRLVQEPEIRRRIVDVFWGPVEVQDASVTLANGDGALTAIYQSDIRGQLLVIKRIDLTYSTLVTEWIGTVAQATLTGDGTLEIQGTNLAIDAFDWDVPWGEITTTDFPKALDVGRTVPVVFGNVPKVLLPNVCNDTSLNEYHYVVRGGTGSGVSFAQLWRDGPNDSLVAIGTGEYTSREDLYAGYLCARFTVQQITFQGGPHRIYADVVGYATERNFVRAVQRIMSDTTWSIGAPIDVTSFNAAASAIAPLGLLCDGALVAPRKAKDWLRQLLMVRGMRLQVSTAGLWQISIDQQAAAPTLILGDGNYAGERNVLSVGRRTRVPQSDRPEGFTLRYRQDLISEEWLFRQTRWADPPAGGQEVIDDSDFIRDHLTADKVTDYRWKRLDYGQETIEDVEMTPAARELTEGQLVRFTYAPVGYTDETLEVREVSKGLAKITATLARWNAAIYTHTPGTLPTDNISGTFQDLSRTPPTPPTNVSIVGSGTEIGSTGGNEAWTTIQYSTPTTNCVGVRIDYKKTGDTIWAGGEIVHGTGANREFRVRGLVAGLSYDYQVVCINGYNGVSSPYVISGIVAGNLPAPADPTAVSFTSWGTRIGTDGKTTAYVTVQATPPASNVTGFRIDLAYTGSGTWHAGYATVAVQPSTAISFEVKGLTPGIPYTIRVASTNATNLVSPGVTVNFGAAPGDATAPSVPSTPTVYETEGKEVGFLFGHGNELDLQGFQWEIRDAAGSGGTQLRTGVVPHARNAYQAVINVAIGYFSYGVTYHFRVAAVDYSGNQSGWSASVPFQYHTQTTPDLDPGSVSTSFSASAGSTGSFAVDGTWQALNTKFVTISYSTSQLFAFGWATVKKTTAGDVKISLRVLDNTQGVSGQPITNILWGGGDFPITPLFCGVFDPSMGAMAVTTHTVILQIKGEGTAGQFFQVDASILETWEQRR
jgi:hypothetical protein